ncbi:MAG: recombinase family protein [Syntrophobacteraceae bacterium]
MTQKAAGYIRVSSDSGEKTSLEDQAKAIKAYAKDKYNLVKIYNEGVYSGADGTRPQFNQLLKDAERKQFQAVIVWNLSRFGREVADVIPARKGLKSQGIELISIQQSFDDSPYGEAMFQMVVTFDELERKIIKDRTHRKRTQLWKENKRWIGKLPFGLAWNDKTKEVEIVEKEANIIRRIVELYLEKVSFSFHDVCIILNKEHIKTQQGRYWNTAHMSALLKKTIYYGYVVVNTKRTNAKREVIGDKPLEEHIVWDDIPPIITKSQWEQVHKKAQSGAWRRGRRIKYADTFLLQGLLKCGLCGSMIYPTMAEGRRYYKCRLYAAGPKELTIMGKHKCSLPSIPAQPIEEWVWDHLEVKFGVNRQGVYSPLLNNEHYETRIVELKVKIANIELEIVKKTRAIKRMDDQLLMADEEYNPTEFKFKRREFANDIKHLNLELTSVKTECGDVEKLQSEQKELEELIGNEQLLWDIHQKVGKLDFEGKRRLLVGLMAEPMTVYPATTNHPFDPARTKPKFHLNSKLLAEVLDLTKYLETSS